MAEALFRLGSKSHEACSCGLATEHGHAASPYAIEAVAELGADLKLTVADRQVPNLWQRRI